MTDFLIQYGEAAKTAVGFFWKAGWAFVLGYAVSAMIQSFVPKKRLTQHMGDPGVRSLSLATVFGAISSSCSFAALSAARALVKKGAHFVAAVAFMFASTNLVIELGILIFIFLGWQFLAAEIVGGILLIAISTLLIRLTYPKGWFDEAREKVQDEGEDEESDFNPLERITSRNGWHMVGRRFFMEWNMVWEEILIGFTVAGFMAVFVPDTFWKALFLAQWADDGGITGALVVLQNAMVAPFVAAATFIGSMGNIPLATVLNSGGVLFAGIMGFIYSDLMVPPLVNVNAKYYGWRAALYIAGIMYVSIVATALILHYSFLVLGLTPESARAVKDVAQFKIDYTFWLNIVFAAIVAVMAFLATKRFKGVRESDGSDEHGSAGISAKRVIALAAMLIIAVGLLIHFFSLA